jgi:hypothetical protein
VSAGAQDMCCIIMKLLMRLHALSCVVMVTEQ